ncbi:MAG: hypothetical protein HY665_06430 [Chloroflexi bacterium]|nr:hypothetical protein [Chloroflexota bacterium]
MTQWVRRFEGHDIFDQLSKLSLVLDESQPPMGEDSAAIEAWERIRQVRSLLESSLEAVDPALVPISLLDNIRGPLENLTAELSQYLSNRDHGYLVQANAYLDHVLTQLNLFLVPRSEKEVEGIGEAITSLRRAIGQHSRYLTEEVQKLQSTIAEVGLKAKQVKDMLDEQQRRFDSEIVTFQQRFTEIRQQLITTENELKAQFTELQRQMIEAENERKSQFSRFEQAWNARFNDETQTRNNQFIEAEQKRSSQFTDAERARSETFADAEKKRQEEFIRETQNQKEITANLIEGIRVDHKDLKEQLLADGQGFLNELIDYKRKAEDLVHIIANTGMAGGYQRVANEERKVARFWQLVTGVSMLGLVGFAIYAFVLTIHGAFNWGMFGGRAFVAVTFGIISAYAARQAEKHEEVERRSRRIELELASIDPYLAPLPEEVQHDVKQQLAERLFGQNESTPVNSTQVTSGTALDLVRIALDNVRVLLEHMTKK